MPQCPFVLALIEFEGADTLFLGRLLGVDPNTPTLDWIGMRVGLRFRRNSKFKPTDVYFYPSFGRAKEEYHETDRIRSDRGYRATACHPGAGPGPRRDGIHPPTRGGGNANTLP